MKTYFLTCLVSVIVFGMLLPASSRAAENAAIQQLTHDVSDRGLQVILTTSSPVVYNAYELPAPPQLVLDLAEAFFQEGTPLPALPDNPVASLAIQPDRNSSPSRTRLIFSLKTTSAYKVQGDDNRITVQITPMGKPQPQAAPAAAPAKTENSQPTVVRAVDVSKSPGHTLVRIRADGPLTDYAPIVLEKKGTTPPRLYVDINNVTGAGLPQRLEVGGAVAALRVGQRKQGLRVVLDASGDSPFPYTLASQDNTLEITIPDADASTTSAAAGSASSLSGARATAPATKIAQRSPTPEVELPQVVQQSGSKQGKSLRDKFNLEGSAKQRISVDFYKIDLHNVFRLIREVSGSNIVVHEDVKGTLTLALNDVPWDFALDVVLNLKGLHKEERDKTIVILPKGKDFSWPERGGNLEFEADANLAVQEAIIIQQQQNIPKEQLHAYPMIQQGRQAEQREEYEDAVAAYGKALALWPKNAALANHIANIELVRLGRNAQALHYARQALAVDSGNHAAALNAAIALANMRRMQEAGQYFDQSVSGAKPSREALLSYSIFAEENERYDAAVLLLKKHNDLYGGTLDSMVALARIMDKQNLPEHATATYRSILHGGFRLPPDLQQYIQTRVNHSPAQRPNPVQP